MKSCDRLTNNTDKKFIHCFCQRFSTKTTIKNLFLDTINESFHLYQTKNLFFSWGTSTSTISQKCLKCLKWKALLLTIIQILISYTNACSFKVVMTKRKKSCNHKRFKVISIWIGFLCIFLTRLIFLDVERFSLPKQIWCFFFPFRL